MEIAKLVLQAVAVFVAVAGLGYTILSAWMKKKEKEMATVKEETIAAVNRLSQEMMAEKANRVENVNRIHERIDSMQSELISDLQGRMSRMEGELKGVTNILTSIQNWFINNSNKGC